MDYLWYLILLAFMIIIALFISNIRSNKKLKSLLINSFGKIPEPKKCDFESIGVYHRYKSANFSKSNIIDGITWDDLDMDLLFKRINSCLTSVGEEYLYDTLHEILKGTNTIERIAASAAVLKYLHSIDCLCITASHDIELTNILSEQYDNYHFREHITDDGIHFDYKLKQGPSQTRNAIKLLDYMNFDSEIVEAAETMVDKFMDTKTW